MDSSRHVNAADLADYAAFAGALARVLVAKLRALRNLLWSEGDGRPIRGLELTSSTSWQAMPHWPTLEPNQSS